MKINEILVEANDGNDDEVFHFGNKSWDVKRGYQLVKQHNIEPEMLPVEGGLASFLGFMRVNDDWAKTTDLSKPVLLIDTGKGVLVIDGYHRIKKAKDAGVKELPGYILSQEQSAEIEIVNEGPLGKAIGTAAVAGAIGMAGHGAMKTLDQLSGIDTQQPQKVAQAPAQAKQDLSKLEPQAQKSVEKPETKAQKSGYTPITGSENEAILADVAQKHGIKGIELAAFMAQMAHESENFRDMVEDGNGWKKYGKGKMAKVLGNRDMNDAERFKGRGFIQLTGRWNYDHYGKKIGMDLTSSWSAAHQASQPEVAAEIAVAYWKDRVQRNVENYADVRAVTKKINSGLHGLESRNKKFVTIAKHMGIDV